MSTFSYMRGPDEERLYQVGDLVEVLCDHDDEEDERVRGWIQGVVVQADEKMVAVQFSINVYLTDGWMVPDRILWYPTNSKHIRFPKKKKRKRRNA